MLIKEFDPLRNLSSGIMDRFLFFYYYYGCSQSFSYRQEWLKCIGGCSKPNSTKWEMGVINTWLLLVSLSFKVSYLPAGPVGRPKDFPILHSITAKPEIRPQLYLQGN